MIIFCRINIYKYFLRIRVFCNFFIFYNNGINSTATIVISKGTPFNNSSKFIIFTFTNF